VQFLATAGRVLVESFDKTDTLKKMAELAVSQISDGCIVRLIGEDGKLHLEAVVHRNPKMQQSLESFAKSVYERGVLPSEVGEALQTITVQIRNDFSRIYKTDTQLNSEERHYLEQLGEFNAVIIPLRAHGLVIGMLSIMSDKSKRRFEESDIGFLESVGNQLAFSIENNRLYNKAQSAIKLREEILAIVSHDLRSPLTAIQMVGKILPKVADDKTKILNFSERILRSTDQMKRMIEDLMDFAKIQEGNLSIEAKVEKPKELVEMVFEMMKTQAEEKHLELTLEIGSELLAIKYDKQRLAQALLNLVGNAIKFTEIGGSICISVLESKVGVMFSVTDTGSGISKEDLPKIFDRYWQAKRSKTLSAGLGLSITKGIIEAHGSQIRVESQLGKGSNFYFILPLSS
jgi:signal transduction histidine kinase